uniref:NAD-dependent epimerase/dehydratase domain-containing protein n=1 Tax=Solanum lycopersicum TaxID=4081 RepID=K4CYD0_SOLLC
MEEKSTCKVCVTGGAGYIGSSLVKNAFGYRLHCSCYPKKLRAEEFEEAIQGCEFVFHVATPSMHYEGSQYKDRTEATVDGVKKIGMICLKNGTVKRLIYTASIVAASPLKEDGITYKQLMDETCWTPLNFSNPYSQQWLWDYVESKMLAEKEVLKFEKEGLEVVTLCCGLVGGHTFLPYMPTTSAMFLSVFTQDEKLYNILKFLEDLNGKVPIVHIEDVCEAHMFFMNNVGSLNGRFLCASSYVSTEEIGNYYQHNYPEFKVNQE